jgi:hypothetical protein
MNRRTDRDSLLFRRWAPRHMKIFLVSLVIFILSNATIYALVKFTFYPSELPTTTTKITSTTTTTVTTTTATVESTTEKSSGKILV